MGEDVKLRIGGDTSGLMEAVKNAISQIKREADKLNISPGAAKGGAVSPGSQAFQQNLQATRMQEQKSRNEQQALQIANRALADKEKELARIARQEAASVNNAKQLDYLAKERNRTEREYQSLIGTRKRLETSLGQGQTSPGINMPKGGITSMSGLMTALGAPAMLLAGLATAVAATKGGESVRRFFSESQLRNREIESSTFQTQGQAGQRFQSILNGGASEELAFNPQRAQANSAAQSAINARYGVMGGSSPLIGGARWALGANALGALQHGNYLQAFRGFAGRLGVHGLGQQFEDIKANEEAGLQSSQFDAIKNGPEQALRTGVTNKYLRDYQRNLDFQRQTGLGTNSFRNDFLGGVNSAGFTDEQGMGMSSNILSANGSTRSAVGNATLGLQAQRNLDLTNSSGVLGKLSGGLGSSSTTKEAFVKILAEGTRAGLDGSDFREENRKFVESAAAAITQSGVSTGAGADQILEQFGKFFGDRTSTGMEAGKNAYELYRQTSMATTGPRGTMRAAGMLTDPTISRLGRDSREALFNMPIDQLTSDNPAIIAMAAQAKVSPQQLIDAQNRVTKNSANLFKNSDQATANLSSTLKKYGRRSALDMQGPFAPGEQQAIQQALGESNIAQVKEHPELGQDQRLASQYSNALALGDEQKRGSILEEAKKTQLEAKTTGRPEDETNRLQAESSRLANQLFMSVKDSITPASDAVKIFAADISALVAAIKSGQGAGTALSTFNSKYGTPGPMTQPSAGSPNSGGGNGR